MSCPSGGYSPSGTKPEEVVADWSNSDLVQLESFAPATREDLLLAHDEKYVDGVFAGTISNGHGNRDRTVADSTLWTVGSMVAAARQALKSGVACSPSSGFHHACYSHGGAFCTFNGLVVAARKLLGAGLVNRAGILDCDWHYGNGTDDILDQLDLRSAIYHRTSGQESFSDSEAYFRWLSRSLENLWESNVDLILYQAGADAHCDDPLGGLLDDDEMVRRDEMVFDFCLGKKIPVAWNLAGGYQKDEQGSIGPVIALHRATMEACIKTYSVRS
jgi:acetoin utilization deacetylase AcuC-like enzyme